MIVLHKIFYTLDRAAANFFAAPLDSLTGVGLSSRASLTHVPVKAFL